MVGLPVENSAVPGLPLRSTPSEFCWFSCAAKLVASEPSWACAGSSDWLRNASNPPTVPPPKVESGRYCVCAGVCGEPSGDAYAIDNSLGSDVDVTACSAYDVVPETSGWPVPIDTLYAPLTVVTCTFVNWLRFDTAVSRASSNWFGGWPCALAAAIWPFSVAIWLV